MAEACQLSDGAGRPRRSIAKRISTWSTRYRASRNAGKAMPIEPGKRIDQDPGELAIRWRAGARYVVVARNEVAGIGRGRHGFHVVGGCPDQLPGRAARPARLRPTLDAVHDHRSPHSSANTSPNARHSAFAWVAYSAARTYASRSPGSPPLLHVTTTTWNRSPSIDST